VLVEVPRPILRLGVLDKVKVGLATTREKDAVTVRVPEVPVIVNVLVPTAAEALAFNNNVACPDVGLGEKDAVTPLGRPETDRFALPLNPYSGVRMIVEVTELPGFNTNAIGELDRAKVGP
jgi:hypothetical protein